MTEEKKFELECRLLADILAEERLSLHDLESDPVSTDRIARIFCVLIGLDREDFHQLVRRILATLTSANQKLPHVDLRDSSLRFRSTGHRHRTLDEIERQPDPDGHTRAQFGKWPSLD